MLMLLLLCGTLSTAQETYPSQALPDAPSAIRQQTEPVRQELLADDPYQPLTKREKLSIWMHKTYAPSTFVAAAMDTAYSSLTGSMRYCCGGDAWGRQYGASVADAESRYLFGKLLFPTLLKQDPRYLPKRNGGMWQRAWYAATRVVVTRRDDGRSTFNSSEFLSIACAKALTNAYYPERDRTWGRTVNSILGDLQGDVSGNLLTEFMPDIKRIVTRHTPRPILVVAGRIPTKRLPF
jgi:hypothetical protein